jgi:transposase-like protein
MTRSKRSNQAARHSHHQGKLFSTGSEPSILRGNSSKQCQVVAVGKRRDGGTRYWCLLHKADATAKYGKPAKSCRAAHIPPIQPDDVLSLDVDKYAGGIALWGAVPAVYDTTRLPMDRGIHVHARLTTASEKEMDCTLRAVNILGKSLPTDGILVSELDAIYYMVSSVFGYEMKYVACSYCRYPHLDRDWFSVHPHRRHLCSGCGKHFTDTSVAVGNPIVGVRTACGLKTHKSQLSNKTLDIKQADFPGGIQVWGSNPAFLWTSDRVEEEGIHIHAFRETSAHPDTDETFGQVVIDGIQLDPLMVRVLMAQSALPSLRDRVQPITCPRCSTPHFSLGDSAFTPVASRTCTNCSREFASTGRLRKTIGNPLPKILAQLAGNAPRSPQRNDLGLLPETL